MNPFNRKPQANPPRLFSLGCLVMIGLLLGISLIALVVILYFFNIYFGGMSPIL